MSIVAAFGVVASAEASDYFLEINGIPGESQDAKMANAVDVLSYSWGATSAGATAKPQVEALNVAKRVDVSSPQLFRRLLAGQVIPSMELLGRRSGVFFLRYCFQNVAVTSIQHGGSAGENSPTEQVRFEYASVIEQYSRQNSDGTIAQTVFAGWNATTGKLINNYPNTCG